MSLQGKSLLSVWSLKPGQSQEIFDRAQIFKKHFEEHKQLPIKNPRWGEKIMAEVFFEPSTRSRYSFQAAAYRLGISNIGGDILSGSSVQKGESHVDTIRTIFALKPDFLVIRDPGAAEIMETLRGSKIPVINAGSGTEEHPTQALLDAFTISEKNGSLKGQKIVFVGDVLHSRVANSELFLFRELGAEVAYCCPPEMKRNTGEWKDVKNFTNLEEASQWATVLMGLRIQSERHRGSIVFSKEEYIRSFRLDKKNLKSLSQEAFIMHPGPFVPYVDFHPEMLEDPRCMVAQQVTNGFFVRAALISLILGMPTTHE